MPESADVEMDRLRKRIRALSEKLADIDFVLHGSVTKHYMRCGHAGCRCMSEPPVLHGPYHDWTRRVEGKTVTVRLTEAQAGIISGWIQNMRRVEGIVSEMEKLTLRAAKLIRR